MALCLPREPDPPFLPSSTNRSNVPVVLKMYPKNRAFLWMTAVRGSVPILSHFFSVCFSLERQPPLHPSTGSYLNISSAAATTGRVSVADDHGGVGVLVL